MEQGFIPILIGATSLGAYLAGRKGFGLSRDGLKEALGKVVELLGMALVFFVGNLALGIAAVLVARFVMGAFITLYLVGDVSLFFLSVLQGLIFQQWWKS
jgi:hypothetical protein